MSIDVTVMARKMRFVVVHYHIFKNAGTTVERVLEREFAGRFARIHGPTPDAVLDAEDLTAFLNDHPNVQAITSHHLRYPVPQMRNVVIFDCCFLRHPLDRIDSLYSYYRKIDSMDPLSRSAHRLTAADFVRQLLNHSPEQISNVQLTYLANRGAFTRPANKGDLRRAVQTVRNMALPGVVEMFRESMVAAEYFLRPAFPSICLAALPANVSRPMLPSVTDRQSRLIQLWGRGLYEELKRLNELDLQLVAHAEEEIRRRLLLVPAVPDRLKEFAGRTMALATAAATTA